MLKPQLTSVFNQVHPIESSHQVKLSSILKSFSTINLKVTLCNCQHPILQELCPWAWPGSWFWRRWEGGCGAGRGWCSWYLLVICEHVLLLTVGRAQGLWVWWPVNYVKMYCSWLPMSVFCVLYSKLIAAYWEISSCKRSCWHIYISRQCIWTEVRIKQFWPWFTYAKYCQLCPCLLHKLRHESCHMMLNILYVWCNGFINRCLGFQIIVKRCKL